MLELSEARLALLEKEGGDEFAGRVRDPELSRLRRVGNRLVNGDEIEVGKVPSQLEAMALRHGEVARQGETRGKLAAQKMKERRDASDQLREIFSEKTLHARWLAGARDLFARKA